MHTLPDAIRTHRRMNLMTQPEYAEHIGVSVGAIMGWEQGIRVPSLAMCRKLIAKGVDKSSVVAAVAKRDTAEAA